MATTLTQDALENWLPIFFVAYQACRTPSVAPNPMPKGCKIDCETLSLWFKSMEYPLEESKRGAFQCDPWEVAGLGRDEVRISAVLAWLINPKGSHGLGGAALQPLLKKIAEHFPGCFPESAGRFCNVRAETNPDGVISNRVDIEIDSENFYLVVEVKIDAQEGKKQLERYGELAELQAAGRPWAMVFLTPSGLPSRTAAQYSAKVLPISWKNLSHMIAQSVYTASQITSGAKGVQRLMAEQIIVKFLKRIRFK